MLKKICCIIGFIVLLPAICLAGEINVKKLNKQDWINIETPNFSVLTNAEEKRTLGIVQELENFKYFLAGALGYQQQDLSEKVPVVVARDKKTFTSLGMPDNTAGVFFSSPEYVVFARGDRFRSSSEGGSNWGRSVVLHELVHLFMQNASLDFAVPVWFSEGVAEYFGSYVERKGKVIIGSLDILGYRIESLRDVDGHFETVDCESLFKTSKSEVNIGEGGSRTQKTFVTEFYARAVAIVHYMYSDPVRLKQMYQYLYLLRNGVSEDDAFNRAFQMAYSDLDSEVYQYLSKWSLTGIAYRLGEGGVEFPDVEYLYNDISKQDAIELLYGKLSILPEGFLGEGEQKRLYAGMEVLYPGLADMVTTKQLSEKPKNLAVLMAAAATYEKLEKYSKAIDLYEKVLLIDGSNPYYLNQFAWFLVTVSDTTFRDPQRAITLAENAVAVKRSANILDTLAEAYYVAGSFQKAIETINEAIALDPEREYFKEQLEKFSDALQKA